jgi:hypothetical protein
MTRPPQLVGQIVAAPGDKRRILWRERLTGGQIGKGQACGNQVEFHGVEHGAPGKRGNLGTVALVERVRIAERKQGGQIQTDSAHDVYGTAARAAPKQQRMVISFTDAKPSASIAASV